MKVKINLNGICITDDISPEMTLLDFVRKHGAKSVKCGCETSNCGACTVLLNELPVLSCSVLAVQANEKSITTVEGLKDKVLEIGRFISEQGAEQCGFCNPGYLLNLISLLKENPNPSDKEIKEYLSGNLCRCSGYDGILTGVKNYLASKGEKR